jgi:hypothetical protein
LHNTENGIIFNITKKINTMTTVENIADRILNELNSEFPHLYFNVKNSDGQILKIRVADHSMNEKNNNDRTLSFVKQTTESKNGQQRSNYEWVIDENGDCERYSTSIEEILNEFEIINMID